MGFLYSSFMKAGLNCIGSSAYFRSFSGIPKCRLGTFDGHLEENVDIKKSSNFLYVQIISAQLNKGGFFFRWIACFPAISLP